MALQCSFMFLVALSSILFSLVAIISGQECPPWWTLYNENCYRHIIDADNRVNYEAAQERCKQHGGRLTDIKDKNEMLFLAKLSRLPGYFKWPNLPLVGLYKTGRDNAVNAYDNSTAYINFCTQIAEPNNHQGREHCMVLVAEDAPSVSAPADPCLFDLFCDGSNAHDVPHGYSRIICKMPLPVVCEKPNTEAVNRTCVCKKDFIDITETDVPERHKYKKGDKCIPKDPCQNVKDLTVNFLVDSSQSIGMDNWDSLVQFLQSGAELLPNSAQVGFVKFSNNVTFAKFLSPGWSQAEFKRFVPSRFDKGETNTAAAFEKATTMFKKDSNRNKVAVLITDGLPFSGELDEKDMLEKTSKAAKKLRSSGVSLIALGYGEELDKKKIRVIHSWLEDPEEDYFEYDKKACELKSVHMCLLMRKVCRRYVTY